MSKESVISLYTVREYFKNILRSAIKGPERIDLPLTKLLEAMSTKGPLTFVQIGSNDGLKNDPIGNLIKQYKWKGIMVEPFESNFSKLKENFNGYSGLVFEQCGITDRSGERDFFYIEDIGPDEPDWYDQVGSFDKTTFLKNIEVVPDLSRRMAIKKISTKTFDELLSEHKMQHVDILHLDTEGYDYKILLTIDFKKFQPTVVIFENEWMTQYELKEIKNYFKKFNYKLYYHHVDCIAVKRS
ncbi:MAG: hypothetical protein C5B59_15020 [Bacteroidetes bacterium]|nr:MAG: hypothetical protein C5B59_15020 [Bacteroidota bacterium]